MNGVSFPITVVLMLLVPAALAAPPPPTTVPDDPGAPPLLAFQFEPLDTNYTLSDLVHWNDVLVVINNQSTNSVTIGEYYVAQRDIPPDHVVYLENASTSQTTNRQSFNDTIRDPIKNHITSYGLQTTINYIVTTKGVPLRVTGNTPPFSGGNSDYASVDNELALILHSGESDLGGNSWDYHGYCWSGTSFICGSGAQVPPFRSDIYHLYLVNRLTAYNVTTVLDMIDRAEHSVGVRGNHVLDYDPGNYAQQNNWLQAANGTLSSMNVPVIYDDSNTYLHFQDNVITYSSWGSNDGAVNGTTARPQNNWTNGSIAETFVSTGGRTFNWPATYGQSLMADWLSEGTNGVKAYVYEPYTIALVNPNLGFPCYVSGRNFAECMWAGNPLVSWMGTVVGDPKMAPFIDTISDPLAFGISLTPEHPNAGQLVDITLTLDNRGPAVQTRWQLWEGLAGSGNLLVDTDGTNDPLLLGGTRHNFSVTWTPPSGTSAQLTLVLDPLNAIGEIDEGNNEFTLDITYNTPPLILEALGPPAAARGSVVSISFNGSDDFTPFSGLFGELEVAWDGTNFATADFVQSAPNTLDWTVAPADPLGEATLRVRIIDLDGAYSGWMTLTTPVDVTNIAPSLVNMTMSTGTALRGELVEVFVEVSDLESDPVDMVMEFEYNLDGGAWANFTPPTWNVALQRFHLSFILDSTETTGLYEFRARIVDGDGDTSPWSSSHFLLVTNAPPQLGQLSMPATVTSGVPVAMTVDASDPDGEVISVQLNLHPEGDASAPLMIDLGLLGGSIWTATSYVNGTENGSWIVSATATDLDGETVTMELGNFTLEVPFVPEPEPEGDENETGEESDSFLGISGLSQTTGIVILAGLGLIVPLILGMMILMVVRSRKKAARQKRRELRRKEREQWGNPLLTEDTAEFATPDDDYDLSDPEDEAW